MQPTALHLLASQQARWLSQRQKTIAENVAHADTPGYRAMDVRPFSEMVETTGLTMSAPQTGHLSDVRGRENAQRKVESETWETTYSGNSVNVEQQMLKASEVHSAYALNINVMKAFSRMLSTAAKS